MFIAGAVGSSLYKSRKSYCFSTVCRDDELRIEGLLAAFPKLMNTGKQHTFVETECQISCLSAYGEIVHGTDHYQKQPNILEDLET